MKLRIVDIDECSRKQFYKDCGGKDSLITVEAAFDMLEALPTAKVIEDIKAEIEEAKEKTFCTDDEKQGLDVALSIIDKYTKGGTDV